MMINFPTKDGLKELKGYKEPFCLTIYAPLIDANSTTNPNRIELKNILRQAEAALLSAGVKPGEVKKTLKPAQLLLEGREFWPIHHESLALFMHQSFFRYYHIPDHATPYLLTVERGFDLNPLSRAMKDNKEYFVLALSHKHTRLYEGDHYQLEPVHLNNFPTDMKKTLNIDEYPNWREMHGIAPSYTGKGSEAYHSQYNVSQTDKDMLLEYFRRIDKKLHSLLQAKKKPLIIAGVEHLLPIYHRANSSPFLLEGGVTGNFEEASLETIRKKAWSYLTVSGA